MYTKAEENSSNEIMIKRHIILMIERIFPIAKSDQFVISMCDRIEMSNPGFAERNISLFTIFATFTFQSISHK